MNKIKMGELLVSLRKEKDLLQQDVAQIFSVSAQAVSKWEKGESIPDVETLQKLSQFYHISIEEILDGELNQSLKSKQQTFQGMRLNINNRQVPNVLLCLGFTIFLLIFMSVSCISTNTTWALIFNYYDIITGKIYRNTQFVAVISLMSILCTLITVTFGLFLNDYQRLKVIYRIRNISSIIFFVSVIINLLCFFGIASPSFYVLALVSLVFVVCNYVIPFNKIKNLPQEV